RLITTAGRKAVMGRPILYRTSKDFLIRFGLNDVDELPSLKEFEELARAALGADAGLDQADVMEMPGGEGAKARETSAQSPDAAADDASTEIPPRENQA
ncbi:MAG TPA: SMC-Scp complex subunit ScpB, partial [Candidatus Acidoferrales bacterium]|nr:SMC-Scp complex subunit ScpB [Candidatus Acidoferrales bacterium]